MNDAAPTITRTADTLERAVFDLDRARALATLGSDEQAQSLLQSIGPILTDQPKADSGRYLLVLGELYERFGNDEDALAMYDLAVSVLARPRSPHVARAYRLLGALLERLGRTTEALAVLRAALEIQDQPSRTA